MKEQARAARRYLTDLVKGGSVALTDTQDDKYAGRVLARASVMGEDISGALLRAGLARPYDGKKRLGWC